MMNAFLIFFSIALTGFVLSSSAEDYQDSDHKPNHSTDFNELKFTQLWGHSSCLQYKEGGHAGVKCRYEDQPSIFSVHGIWPTETGTSGPNFCTKVKFDETALESIEPDLNRYWYEISATKNPSEFWSHEWLKHGSCAQVVPDLSTELKYFGQGLSLRTKYDLYAILKENNIVPQDVEGKGYLTSDFVEAFRKGFGASPYIQCLHTKPGDVHLLAVEICLDRNLTPIDCSTHDTRHLDLEGVLPCPQNHPILYQDSGIPLPNKNAEL